METCFIHCRPGGASLFVPDWVRETFRPSTQHGGHDGDGRSLRYLEWPWDPDPTDRTYLVDVAYCGVKAGVMPSQRLMAERSTACTGFCATTL
jgi:hypothetical protein